MNHRSGRYKRCRKASGFWSHRAFLSIWL